MALTRSLSQGCQGLSTQVVATHRGQRLTGTDLSHRIQQWRSSLSVHSGERWAIFHSDAFEFLAMVLALWSLKRTVCLPGDNRLGTVQRLQSRVDGFVGEFPDATKCSESACDIEDDLESQMAMCQDFPALEIYTSGSTGEPKAIVKTLAQLDAELEALDTLWPVDAETVVLGTVSHQHLYGLTFRVLRPFCSGQSFERLACEYWEDVFHRSAHYSALALISSPSHLSRLNKELNWAALTQKWCQIISSAAPLARDDSLLIHQVLGIPVHEIYGSSETGAIAWRVQSIENAGAVWRAIPSVQLSTADDGTLFVRSPFLADAQPELLPDRVRFFQDGSFELLGRADRIVKVEGKRVSLAALEQSIETFEWIKQAKTLILERRRVETAAVVELGQRGLELLQQRGRPWLVQTLKKALREQYESVVIPRRWRFVERMPYNSQGKLTLEAMKDLFEEKKPEIWPKVIRKQIDGHQAKYLCEVDESLLYFDGHFSGHPILPGIVQVHWAESFGRESFDIQGQFQSLEAIKFQRVIRPGGPVTLMLTYDDQKNKLSFQYLSDEVIHSSGRICFG